MKNKIILTDCDEVMLEWASGFENWMLERGHEVIAPDSYNCRVRFGLNENGLVEEILEFNHSEAFGELKPVDKAVKNIQKLHAAGFQFIVITSCTVNPTAKRWRKENLFREFAVRNTRAFDKRMFISVVCLPCGGEKDAALKEFTYTHEGCFWIEDNAYNADVGHDLGFDSILIERPHNQLYTGPANHLKDWDAIHDYIMENH